MLAWRISPNPVGSSVFDPGPEEDLASDGEAGHFDWGAARCEQVVRAGEVQEAGASIRAVLGQPEELLPGPHMEIAVTLEIFIELRLGGSGIGEPTRGGIALGPRARRHPEDDRSEHDDSR